MKSHLLLAPLGAVSLLASAPAAAQSSMINDVIAQTLMGAGSGRPDKCYDGRWTPSAESIAKGPARVEAAMAHYRQVALTGTDLRKVIGSEGVRRWQLDEQVQDVRAVRDPFLPRVARLDLLFVTSGNESAYYRAQWRALTEGLFGGAIDRPIDCWNSRSGPFDVGAFRITPFLTDHSAFDAYMLLIEAAGKRILYTGDFRVHGRKSSLIELVIRRLGGTINVLLMEGTNLRSDKPIVSEPDLENQFVDLARATPGQVYVQWSAQNIDRTVTIYKAARRSGRELVVDLYAADVLARVANGTKIPQPGNDFPDLRVLILPSGKRLFERSGRGDVADAMARQPSAMSRRRLAGRPSIIMLRDSMLRDFERAGLVFQPDDAYVFSSWRGYLDLHDPKCAWNKAAAVGAQTIHLHTSGHASSADLQAFAAAIAPQCLVPVHGLYWDDPGVALPPVKRLLDGETWRVDP